MCWFCHTRKQKHRITFAMSVQSSPCPTFQGSSVGQEGKRRSGQQRMRRSDRTTDSMDTNLSKLRGTVKDRGAWQATVHRVTKSRTRLGAWTAEELDKAQEMWRERAGIQPAGYTAKMHTDPFKVGESSSIVWTSLANPGIHIWVLPPPATQGPAPSPTCSSPTGREGPWVLYGLSFRGHFLRPSSTPNCSSVNIRANARQKRPFLVHELNSSLVPSLWNSLVLIPRIKIPAFGSTLRLETAVMEKERTPHVTMERLRRDDRNCDRGKQCQDVTVFVVTLKKTT